MGIHTTVPVKPYNYADSFWCTYMVSVVAASIAEMLTYPLDLTKTRLQIQGEVAAANSGVSTAPYRGMLKTALGIAREEGVPRLWQGVTPAIYRHVVYSGIRIVTYERIRDNVLKKDSNGAFPIWKSAIAGVTSGALAQFIASPTDLVKVQIQMEGKRRLLGKAPRVHGTWHAFQKIVNEGGVRGLWKGSIPNMQRAALVNLGDLTTYDTAKQFILSHTSLPDSHLVHMLSSACAGLVAAIMGTPADVVKTRIMNQPTDASGRYQNELPKKIKSRGKDAHLIHEELVQLMKWKQTRGKFYPQLNYLVKVNTPRAVMAETKKAFRKLPNLEQAITALSNLKGVGTTMASALLAAAAPDKAPFMADECLMAIPDIEGIDYTTKEYLNFVNHIQNVADRLNKENSNNGWWSAHRVELALWTHYVACELKPELLDGMPNGSVHHQNGDSQPSPPTEALTIPADETTTDGLECSDESNLEETNGDAGKVDAADDTTTTSYPETSDQDSCSLQEEPPTKKLKVTDSK